MDFDEAQMENVKHILFSPLAFKMISEEQREMHGERIDDMLETKGEKMDEQCFGCDYAQLKLKLVVDHFLNALHKAPTLIFLIRPVNQPQFSFLKHNIGCVGKIRNSNS